MSRRPVYDLPTRIFHWLFAGLFLTAFVITKTVDDEDLVFSYHMMAGITLSFLIILRVIWGVVGTKHAKFSGFDLKPANLVSYLSGIISGSKERWAGHNPASSWAAIIMMVMGLGLGVTGYTMATGPENHTIKDVHEIFANTFLIAAILHVSGIILHTMRHKELIGLSMIDGQKDGVSASDSIDSPRTAVGIAGLALVTAFAINLANNFDPETRSLNLFGTTLQLGENEDENEDEEEEAAREQQGETRDNSHDEGDHDGDED